MLHAEQWCPNTSNVLLLGPSWRQLLARVGDEIMLNLLTNGAIFIGLGNGNYLQVSGRPINEVARERYLAIATRNCKIAGTEASPTAGNVTVPAAATAVGAPGASKLCHTSGPAAVLSPPLPLPIAATTSARAPAGLALAMQALPQRRPRVRYSWFVATLQEARELQQQRWAQGRGQQTLAEDEINVGASREVIYAADDAVGVRGTRSKHHGGNGDGSLRDGVDVRESEEVTPASPTAAGVISSGAEFIAARPRAAEITTTAPKKRPRAWQRRKAARQRHADDADAAKNTEGAEATTDATKLANGPNSLLVQEPAASGPVDASTNDDGMEWDVLSFNTLDSPVSQVLCRSPWPLWDFTYDMPESTPPVKKRYGLRLLEVYDEVNEGLAATSAPTFKQLDGDSLMTEAIAAAEAAEAAGGYPDGGVMTEATVLPKRRRGGRRRRQRKVKKGAGTAEGDAVPAIPAIRTEATAPNAAAAAAIHFSETAAVHKVKAAGVSDSKTGPPECGGSPVPPLPPAAVASGPALASGLARGNLFTAERQTVRAQAPYAPAAMTSCAATGITLHQHRHSPHPMGISQQRIPRANIFYCATFGSRAGLPAKHMLCTLQSVPRPHHRLFSHIFAPPQRQQQQQQQQQQQHPTGLTRFQRYAGGSSGGGSNMAPKARWPHTKLQGVKFDGTGGTGTGGGGAVAQGGSTVAGDGGGAIAATVPVVPPGQLRSDLPTLRRRDVRRHAHLLRLLKQLLARARRCPFGLLLEHHCPLPPALRKDRRRSDAEPGPQHQQQGQGQRDPTCSQGPSQAQPKSQPNAVGGSTAVAAAVQTVVEPKTRGAAPIVMAKGGAAGLRAGGCGPLVEGGPGGCDEEGGICCSPASFSQHPITQLLPLSPVSRRPIAPSLVLQNGDATADISMAPSQGVTAKTIEGADAGGGVGNCDRGEGDVSGAVWRLLGDTGSAIRAEEQQQRAPSPPQSPPLERQSQCGNTACKSQTAFEQIVAELFSNGGHGRNAAIAGTCVMDDSRRSARPVMQPSERPGAAHVPFPGQGGACEVLKGQDVTGPESAGAAIGAAAAATITATPGSSESLLPCCVPAMRVVAFLWSVVRHIVPPVLLGSAHNRKVIRRALSLLVSLRRHEHITVHMAAQGLRTREMDWRPGGPTSNGGCSPCRHRADQRLLFSWLSWLMKDLAVPLLRANFYVTESEPYRQQVFYYRKPVWARLQGAALEDLKATRLQAISRSEARRVLSSRPLGPARLRLVPKMSGMRPIVNLSRPTRVTFKQPRTRTRSQGKGAALAFEFGVPAATAAQRQPPRPTGNDTSITLIGAVGTARAERAEMEVAAVTAAEPAAVMGPENMEVEMCADALRRPDAANVTEGGEPGGSGNEACRKRPPGRTLPRGRCETVKLNFRSFNGVLQNAQLALKASLERQPNALGCSVFGLDGIYRAYAPFVRAWRAAGHRGAAAAPGTASGAGAEMGPQQQQDLKPQRRRPRVLACLRPSRNWLPKTQHVPRQQQKRHLQQQQQKQQRRKGAQPRAVASRPTPVQCAVTATRVQGLQGKAAVFADGEAPAGNTITCCPIASPEVRSVAGTPGRCAVKAPQGPKRCRIQHSAVNLQAASGSAAFQGVDSSAAATDYELIQRGQKWPCGLDPSRQDGLQDEDNRGQGSKTTPKPDNAGALPHHQHCPRQHFVTDTNDVVDPASAAVADGDRFHVAVMAAESLAEERGRPQAKGTAQRVAAGPPPSPQPAHPPAVYIVCADITKAYDSLLQGRLMALMESLVDHPDYLMLRGVEVSPSVGLHGVRSRPSNTAHPGALTYPGYPTWLAANKADAFNTIFLDKLPQQRPISRSEVISLLRQAVGNNLMRVGSSWFRQAVGVAQGAVTSTLLCSLYMASLEQQHLLPLLPRPTPTGGGNATVAGKATAVLLPPPPQPQHPEPQARRRGRRGGRRPSRRQLPQRYVHGPLSGMQCHSHRREGHGKSQQHEDQIHPQRQSGALNQAEPMQGDSLTAHAQGHDLLLASTRALDSGAEYGGAALHCLPHQNILGRVATDVTALLAAAVANTITATAAATDHRSSRSGSVGLTALAAALSVAADTTGSLSVGDGSGGSGQFASMPAGHSKGLRSPPGSGIYGGGGSRSMSKPRSLPGPEPGFKSAAGLRASPGGGVSTILLQKVASLAAVAVAVAVAATPATAAVEMVPATEEQHAIYPAALSAVPLPLSHPHHHRLLRQLQCFAGVTALVSWLQTSAHEAPGLPLPYPAHQPRQHEYTDTQQVMDVDPGLYAWKKPPDAPSHSVVPFGWSAGVNGAAVCSEGGPAASMEGGKAAGEAPRAPGTAGRIAEPQVDRQTPVGKHNHGPASATGHNCSAMVLGLPHSAMPGSRVSVAASAPYGKSGRLGLVQNGASVAADGGLAAATPLRRCPLVLSQSQSLQPEQDLCKSAGPKPPLALSQTLPPGWGQGLAQEQQQRWLMACSLQEEGPQGAVLGALQVPDGVPRSGLMVSCGTLLSPPSTAPAPVADSGRRADAGPGTSDGQIGDAEYSRGNEGTTGTQPGKDIPYLGPSSGNTDESVPPSLMAALVLETPLPLQLQLPVPYPSTNPNLQQQQQQAPPNEQMEEQVNQMLGHHQGERHPRQWQQEPQRLHLRDPGIAQHVPPENPLRLQLPPFTGSEADADGVSENLSRRASLGLHPRPGDWSAVDQGGDHQHLWPQPQLQGTLVATPLFRGPPRVHSAGGGDAAPLGTPPSSLRSPPSVITITSTTNTSAISDGAAAITISGSSNNDDEGSPVVAGGVVTSTSPVRTTWHLRLGGGRTNSTYEVLPNLHLSLHDSGISAQPDLRGGGTSAGCLTGLDFSRDLTARSSGGTPGDRIAGGTKVSTGSGRGNASAVPVEVIDLRDSPPGTFVETNANTDKLAGAEQLDHGEDTILSKPCLRTSSPLPFPTSPLLLGCKQHEHQQQAVEVQQQQLSEEVIPVTQDLLLAGGPGLESVMGGGVLPPGGATQPLSSSFPPPLQQPPAPDIHVIVAPDEGGFHVALRAPAPPAAALATGLVVDDNSHEVLCQSGADTQPLPAVTLATGVGTAAIAERCNVAGRFTVPMGSPPTLQLAPLRCSEVVEVRALMTAPAGVARQSHGDNGRVLSTPRGLPLTQAMESPEVSRRTLLIRTSPAPAPLSSPLGNTQPLMLSAGAVDFGCLAARWKESRWLPSVETVAAVYDGQETASQHLSTQPAPALQLQTPTVMLPSQFGTQTLHMEQHRCQQRQPALASPPSLVPVVQPNRQTLAQLPTITPVPLTQLQSGLLTQSPPLPAYQFAPATALLPFPNLLLPHEGFQLHPAGTQPINFAPQIPFSVAHIPTPLLPTQPTASNATDMDMAIPPTLRFKATTEAEPGAPAFLGSEPHKAGDTQTSSLRAADSSQGGKGTGDAGESWVSRAARGWDSKGSGTGGATASGPGQSDSLCCGYSDEDVWLRVGRATAAAVEDADDDASVARTASITGALHTPTHTSMQAPGRALPLPSAGTAADLTNQVATALPADVSRAVFEDFPSAECDARVSTRNPPDTHLAAAVELVNVATEGIEAAREPAGVEFMTTDATFLGLADMDIDADSLPPVELAQLGMDAGFAGAVPDMAVPPQAGPGATLPLQVQVTPVPGVLFEVADGDAMQLGSRDCGSARDLHLTAAEDHRGVPNVAARLGHVAGAGVGGSTDMKASGTALAAEPVLLRQLRGCRGGRRLQWKRKRQQKRQEQQQPQQQLRRQDLRLRCAADKLPPTGNRSSAAATSALLGAPAAEGAPRRRTAATVASPFTGAMIDVVRGNTGNTVAAATAGPRGYTVGGSNRISAGANCDRNRAGCGAAGARTAATGTMAAAAMLTAGPADERRLQARDRIGLAGSSLPRRPERPTDPQPGLQCRNPSQCQGGDEGPRHVPYSEHAVQVLQCTRQFPQQLLQRNPHICQPQHQPCQQQNEQQIRNEVPQRPRPATDFQHPRPRQPQPNPYSPTPPESLLMRLIDDFFIVTTSRTAAEAIARRLREGFLEDYGCVINPGKTQLANFQLPSADQPPTAAALDPRYGELPAPQEQQNRNLGSGARVRGGGAEGGAGVDSRTASALGSGAATAAGDGERSVHVVPLGGGGDGCADPGFKGDGACNLWQSRDGRRYVRWCGLLFNVATLEVQADYSRYCGVHIRTTMSVPADAHPGRQLAAKMCQYLRPKAHALLLDTSINAPHTVRLNIYQAYLLAAIKMHWYLHCLPRNLSRDPRVALSAIQSGICYMVALVRSRTASEATNRRFGPGCRCDVSSCHVRWLGLVAFRRVLFRKQSRYRVVLSCLDKQLAAPSFAALPRQLAEVVSEEANAVFNDVLY
ncbi:hypothetical protein VaNZ11_016772 [Volvox africanus]|uniref:Telomerase reverse transcriptase n=1 Tax=Volvox africanus TaxID=51714 RepID=A0ABQ5SPT6_9CHLO|nr:hypothetical protein VaNZ11_016772 [Volvox africanus]